MRDHLPHRPLARAWCIAIASIPPWRQPGGKWHPASILHPAPCTLHPAPCTMHPTLCTLHPAPYTPGLGASPSRPQSHPQREGERERERERSGTFLASPPVARTSSSTIIIIIISVLFITLICNLPEWCDKTKLSNLLLPQKGGTIKSLQLLSTSGTLLGTHLLEYLLEEVHLLEFILGHISPECTWIRGFQS